MNCHSIQNRLTEFITGQLDDTANEAVRSHLGQCQDCRARFQELAAAWDSFGRLPRPEPSKRLRRRFYAFLEQEKKIPATRQKTVNFRFRISWMTPRLAAVAAIFLAGLFFGYEIGAQRARNGRLLELGQEVQSIKQQMSISMLQQQSSFERMKGVQISTEVSQPGDLLIQMLFSKINTDPSVPVRLAAVDAVALFSDRENVQTLLINSLLNQESPLVQVAIIDQLNMVREKTALKALKMLIESQDTQSDVKTYAEKILQEIS